MTHVVMFTLANAADRSEFLERLRSLVGAIPSLLDLECGSDESGKDSAADIVLITRHADAAGLASYVEHPTHQELVEWIRPRVTGRVVVDTSDLR